MDSESQEDRRGQTSRQNETAGPPSGDRMRRRSIGVDEAVRRAQQEGAFDNLPGRGKPLQWDSPSDDEWWLANHMLRNAGYAPDWIRRGKELRDETDALRQALRTRLGHSATPADVEGLGPLRERAEKLNRDIEKQNLRVPVATARMALLRFEDEVERARTAVSTGGLEASSD